MKENNSQTKILHPAKMSLKDEILSQTKKSCEFITTRPALTRNAKDCSLSRRILTTHT